MTSTSETDGAVAEVMLAMADPLRPGAMLPPPEVIQGKSWATLYARWTQLRAGLASAGWPQDGDLAMEAAAEWGIALGAWDCRAAG